MKFADFLNEDRKKETDKSTINESNENNKENGQESEQE